MPSSEARAICTKLDQVGDAFHRSQKAAAPSSSTSKNKGFAEHMCEAGFVFLFLLHFAAAKSGQRKIPGLAKAVFEALAGLVMMDRSGAQVWN